MTRLVQLLALLFAVLLTAADVSAGGAYGGGFGGGMGGGFGGGVGGGLGGGVGGGLGGGVGGGFGGGAGGGAAAVGSPATRMSGPAISAFITLDPHMEGVTSTAKEATVTLVNGARRAEAQFKVPVTFALFRGCDLQLTPTRFGSTRDRQAQLTDWIPAKVLQQLFTEMGIKIDAKNMPIITDITKADCRPDPANPGPIADGGDGQPSHPGLLTMEAVIQFRVTSN